MKKIFFAAAAMVAVLFASCEKIEPTAVSVESMTAKATVCGFVQYKYLDDGATEVDVLASQEVIVLRGTKVGSEISYVEYKTTTNRDGYYTIDLPAVTGKAIDKVKVKAQYKGKTEATTSELKTITTDAIFQAEVEETPMEGKSTQVNLILTPAVLLDQPGLSVKF